MDKYIAGLTRITHCHEAGHLSEEEFTRAKQCSKCNALPALPGNWATRATPTLLALLDKLELPLPELPPKKKIDLVTVVYSQCK